MGWLARKHGLQANSVTAIELVTADGRLAPRRRDPRAGPVLGPARRRRQLRRRDRDRVRGATRSRSCTRARCSSRSSARPRCCTRGPSCCRTLPDELMTWASLVQLPAAARACRSPPRRLVRARLRRVPRRARRRARELLRPLRDLGPEMDTFAMVPPAALGDLAMDPPEPLPFVTARRCSTTLPAAGDRRPRGGVGPELGIGLATWSSCATWAARSGARRRAPGARATLPGEVCLFALGRRPDDAAAGRREAARSAGVEAAIAPHRAGHYPNFVEEPVRRERVLRRGHVGAPAAREGAVRPRGPVPGQPPHPARRLSRRDSTTNGPRGTTHRGSNPAASGRAREGPDQAGGGASVSIQRSRRLAWPAISCGSPNVLANSAAPWMPPIRGMARSRASRLPSCRSCSPAQSMSSRD